MAICTAPGESPCTQTDSTVIGDGRSVDGGDLPGTAPCDATRSAISAGSCSTASRFPPGDQLPVGPVGAVGERLGDGAQAESVGLGEEHRTGQPEHGQAGSTACTASATARAWSWLVTIVLYSAPWGLT